MYHLFRLLLPQTLDPFRERTVCFYFCVFGAQRDCLPVKMLTEYEEEGWMETGQDGVRLKCPKETRSFCIFV